MNVKNIETSKNTCYYLNNRKYLVKLLKYLAYKSKFQSQTLYLSIYLMDIVFNHPEFEISQKVECYAISCIMIAAKFDENDPNIPDLRHFQTTSSNFLAQNHSKHSYLSINELRSTEVICMKILNHKLNYFTTYHFLFYFLCHGVVLQSELIKKSLNEESSNTLVEDIKSLSKEILEKVIESEEEIIFNHNWYFAISVIFLAREILFSGEQEEFLSIIKIVYGIEYKDFKEMFEYSKKIWEGRKIPIRNTENEEEERKRISRKASPKIDKKYRALSSNKYNYENLQERILETVKGSREKIETKVKRVNFNFKYNNYDEEIEYKRQLIRNEYNHHNTPIQMKIKSEKQENHLVNENIYSKYFPSSKYKDTNSSRNIKQDLVQRTKKVFDDKDVRKPSKKKFNEEIENLVNNRNIPTNNPSTIIINNNININTFIPKEYITKSSQNIEKEFTDFQSQNEEKLVILKRGNSDIINLKQVISMDSQYKQLQSRNRYEPTKKTSSNKTTNTNIHNLQLNFDYNQIHDEFS